LTLNLERFIVHLLSCDQSLDRFEQIRKSADDLLTI